MLWAGVRVLAPSGRPAAESLVLGGEQLMPWTGWWTPAASTRQGTGPPPRPELRTADKAPHEVLRFRRLHNHRQLQGSAGTTGGRRPSGVRAPRRGPCPQGVPFPAELSRASEAAPHTGARFCEVVSLSLSDRLRASRGTGPGRPAGRLTESHGPWPGPSYPGAAEGRGGARGAARTACPGPRPPCGAPAAWTAFHHAGLSSSLGGKCQAPRK